MPAAVKSDATALTVTASLGAYAPNGDKGSVAMPTGVFDDDGDTLEDKDGDAFNIDSIAGDGRITLDGVRPNRTFYIQLGDDRFNPTTILDDGCMATASQLADDSLFRISIDKEGDGQISDPFHHTGQRKTVRRFVHTRQLSQGCTQRFDLNR